MDKKLSVSGILCAVIVILLILSTENYFSNSAIFIARTFKGSPNKVINPSASWWSYQSPVVKLAKDSL